MNTFIVTLAQGFITSVRVSSVRISF